MGVPTVLDLFSGYGGFQLGLRIAYPEFQFKTVAYVDWDEYAQKILRARIADGVLDDAPIWGGDIRDFDPNPWRGLVDIIVASFPCQPHSFNGSRKVSKGIVDDRDLWPATLGTISAIRPRAAILENVSGIVSCDDLEPAYVGSVVGSMAAIGFDSRIDVIPASFTGAPHKRNRWWCIAVADADGFGSQGDKPIWST